MKTLVAYFSAEFGKTAEKLKSYVKGASSIKAKLTQTVDQLEDWAKELL